MVSAKPQSMDRAPAAILRRSSRILLTWFVVGRIVPKKPPGFNERFYGARSFGELLEEAEDRGLLKLELDDRSGGYVIKSLTSEK